MDWGLPRSIDVRSAEPPLTCTHPHIPGDILELGVLVAGAAPQGLGADAAFDRRGHLGLGCGGSSLVKDVGGQQEGWARRRPCARAPPGRRCAQGLLPLLTQGPLPAKQALVRSSQGP